MYICSPIITTREKFTSTWRKNEKLGASTMRNFRYFDHAATIWKIFYLLSLILFTFDFPRDICVRAEHVTGNAELVIRNDDHDYRITKTQEDNPDDPPWHVIHDDENSRELFGKWRNNGEALEPKWRDGDTVPLLPFPHLTRYSTSRVNSDEEGDDYPHRGTKYRRNNARDPYTRPKNDERISHFNNENYESIEDRRANIEHEIFSRKRNNRLSTSQNAAGSALPKETSKESETRNRDPLTNRDFTSRYRETFQARPNDYEQELNDEEYLKPRPRKRRPPQNYEFALAANEASLRDQKVLDNTRSWSRANARETTIESKGKNHHKFSQNAVELKSLLKMQQEEGLSLSEILQRRNLTLNDLLKGNVDVISALKSKDSNETEDYVEKTTLGTSTTMSLKEDSYWKSTTDDEMKNSTMDDRHSSNDSNNKSILEFTTSSSTEYSIKTEKTSVVDVDEIKVYPDTENAVTGKLMIVSSDRPQTPMTTYTTMPTVITTSATLLVATNSMESLGNVGITKESMQDEHETKTESLDEDEIMEFSDFTDYKKGRNGMSPVWLMMNEQESTKSPIQTSKDDLRDTGSTLSIEQILSPTEKIKSMNSSIIEEENLKIEKPEVKIGKMYSNSYQAMIIERPGDDYSTLLEQEYQDDAPMIQKEPEYSTKIIILDDSNDMPGNTMRGINSNFDTSNNYPIVNHSSSTMNMTEENNHNYSLKNHQIADKYNKTYKDIMSEIEPEARAEIFELFASGSAGKRLERLLKSRNMSVEELIALRQRGSSRVHLAEVTRLRSQSTFNDTPEKDLKNSEATPSQPLNEDLGEIAIESVTENESSIQEHNKVNDYPLESLCDDKKDSNVELSPINFVRVDKSTTKEADEESLTNEEEPLTTNFESQKEKEETKETKEKNHHEIVDLLTTFASLPFGRDIERDFRVDYKNLPEWNNHEDITLINDNVETSSTKGSLNDESGFVEEIWKEKLNILNSHAVYNENNGEGNSKESSQESNSLSKVKPSIIASGAILGVTIVVFLAIFIACRIRQKQKYRYRNTFSRAVFQGPVLAARKLSNSSSLSTVMVNIVATSTAKRPEKNETQGTMMEREAKSDIDNDSLDANDSWETIPDYMK